METVKKQYDKMLEQTRARVKKAQGYVDTCNEMLSKARTEADKTIKNLTIMHYIIICVAAAGLIATGHSIKLIDVVICTASILAIRPFKDETIGGIARLLSVILIIIRTIGVPFGDALEDYYMPECVFSIVFMVIDVVFALRTTLFIPLDLDDDLDDNTFTTIDICTVIIFTVTTLTELVFVHFGLSKGLCCAVLILALVMFLYAARNIGELKKIKKENKNGYIKH